MIKENSTILVLSLALIVLFLFSGNFLFVYLSLGIGLACLFSPWLAQQIHWLWMKLSVSMGTVSSIIILTAIFCVIIVPLSFIARLTGKKFLVLKRSKSSYFKERNFLYDKESIEDVW